MNYNPAYGLPDSNKNYISSVRDCCRRLFVWRPLSLKVTCRRT